MDWQMIAISVLLTLAAVILAVGIGVLRRSVRRALIGPLGERLGLRHDAESNDDGDDRITLTGRWASAPASVVHVSTAWYEPDELRLQITRELPLRGRVSFRRKGLLHRLALRFGLLPEIGPADRDFHRWIAAEAENDADIEPLTADAGVREALLRLIRDRRTRVEARPGGVRVIYRGQRFLPGTGLRRPAEPNRAQATLDDLYQLADTARTALRTQSARRPAAPATDTPDAERTQSADTGAPALLSEMDSLYATVSRHPWGKLVLIGPVLMLAGPAVLLWGTDYPPITWDLYLLGLAGGLLLLIAYALLAYRVLRGRTQALRDFGIAVGAAVIGLLTFTPGLLAGVNGTFDQGSARQETAAVQRHLGDGHHVQVRLDAPSSRLLIVAVSRSVYADLERGDELEVRVMPGAIGFPWLAGPVHP